MWMAPAAGGVALLGAAAILICWPELLAYFVAALFALAGFTMLGFAWRMRRAVTQVFVRREWRVEQPPDSGPL